MARLSYRDEIPPASAALRYVSARERMQPMRKLPVVPICRRPLLLLVPPNHKHDPRRPASMKRGVTADRHETWVRDAMDAGGVERAHVARTNDADADGEVVWSWRSEAGAKSAESFADDGGNQAMVTGESAE
jgi:hypothetical protein